MLDLIGVKMGGTYRCCVLGASTVDNVHWAAIRRRKFEGSFTRCVSFSQFGNIHSTFFCVQRIVHHQQSKCPIYLRFDGQCFCWNSVHPLLPIKDFLLNRVCEPLTVRYSFSLRKPVLQKISFNLFALALIDNWSSDKTTQIPGL